MKTTITLLAAIALAPVALAQNSNALCGLKVDKVNPKFQEHSESISVQDAAAKGYISQVDALRFERIGIAVYPAKDGTWDAQLAMSNSGASKIKAVKLRLYFLDAVGDVHEDSQDRILDRDFPKPGGVNRVILRSASKGEYSSGYAKLLKVVTQSGEVCEASADNNATR